MQLDEAQLYSKRSKSLVTDLNLAIITAGKLGIVTEITTTDTVNVKVLVSPSDID